MSQYIPIDKTKIPYQFDIRLNKITFTLEINYNSTGDFFTVAITDSAGNELSCGEKITLNRPLLSSYEYAGFPIVTPIDRTGVASRITWGNFGETVKLYVTGSGE